MGEVILDFDEYLDIYGEVCYYDVEDYDREVEAKL